MGIDVALQRLVDSGILGVLLVLSLITISFLYNENKKERESRLNDLKQYSTNDQLFIAQIKQTLENILDLIRGSNK